jgi:hypothetical protein
MRKTIFFIFGVLLAAVVLYWVDGYYMLPTESRISFFNYIGNDINQKLSQAKTDFKALPDLLLVFQQNQGIISKSLISQLQKSLEAHYLLEGNYPMDLSKIIDNTELPNGAKLEYRRTESGYILRLVDKDGSVIKEVSK